MALWQGGDMRLNRTLCGRPRPSARLACCLGLMLLLSALGAHAQEQERKLVDRLLEPNTALANPNQNKQFNGAGAVTAKSAATREFYVSKRELAKTFVGTREVSTRSYSSREWAAKAAYVPPAPASKTFATEQARGVKSARESDKDYQTRKFAGNRPFLGRGKSQSALHQQDRPLSIDDVRELLNKNK
jgi:hypothetical protein